MILTEEELQSRLNSSKNLANKFNKSVEQKEQESEPRLIIEEYGEEEFAEADAMLQIDHVETGIGGRDPGVPNLSVEDVNAIATLSALGITQHEIGDKFGVTQPDVSYISRKHTKVNRRNISDQLEDIKNKALDKLLSSIDCISDDKLKNADAVKLSNIARNLSSVVDNTRDKSNDIAASGVKIVIFTPEMRKESSYTTIDI